MSLANTLRWIRRNPAAILFMPLCIAWISYIIVLAVRNAKTKAKS